jgi:hypothetical protein
MDTPRQPSEFEAAPIENLPEKPTTDQDADSIKGGAIRRIYGGDDDLEDLEVER